MTNPEEQPIPNDPSPRAAARPPIGDVIPLREATRVWFAISLQTFGGPAGQIAIMQSTLVDEKRWIGQKRFLHALSYCTLLPGPEAQQLAIYIGWLLNGVRGGLIAGTLFVFPGVVALLGLSALYVGAGDTTVVTAILAAVAPAVLAIVAQAVVRVGGRALGHPALVALAVGAFVALSAFAVPFPLVIALAAVIGWALGRWAPHTMAAKKGHGGSDEGAQPLIPDDALHTERRSRVHALKVVGLGMIAWAVPVGAVIALTGRHSVFTDQALFFTGAALVTFGGAYAVLAYVAQKAVEVYGWLAPGEMVTGLALAETTPGPLIMVVQFVAFVGAPYVERLRGNEGLSAALTGIMAAVVGVIANLAIFFAVHTLFRDVTAVTWGPVHLLVPDPGTLKLLSLAIALFAAFLLFSRKWSVLRTLGACALIGLGAGLVQVLTN